MTLTTTIKYTITWSAEDAVYYCVKEGSANCTESDWKKTNGLKSINSELNLSDTKDGIKTITVYLKDIAQNESTEQKTITVDKTAPTVTLTLKGTADTSQTLINGDIYTQTKSITYTANITEDNMDSYCIGEGDCTTYISSTTKTLNDVKMNVNDTEGLKTIKINVKDKAGNVGSTSQTITLDKTNPVIGNFTITGNKVSTSESLTSGYTQTTKVNYSVTWSSNDVESFCINTSNSISGCNWNSDSSSPGTLNEQTIPSSTTQGEKTLYAFVRDVSGRVSSSKVGNIKYDSTDPNVSISNETSTTDTITYTITANDDYPKGSVTTSCRAVASGETTDGTISGTTCTIKGLNANTSYTIYAKAVDLSGRYKEANKTISTKSAKLGDYVASKNPKGLSTGELGGLYRFYGVCNATGGGCTDVVDNFICFGTDSPSTYCIGKVTSDYMYRIIGIDPTTGDLKLIKNTAIKEGGTSDFSWNPSEVSNLEWPNANIYKRLNGTMNGTSKGQTGTTNLFVDSTTTNVIYIKSTGDDNDTKWYKMIKDTNWLYGDIGYNGSASEGNKPADEIYQIETGNKSTTTGYSGTPYTWKNSVPAKIGLMYLHDYYYSYTGEGTTNCSRWQTGCSASWLYLSNNGAGYSADEWMVSRYGDLSATGRVSAWVIHSEGTSSVMTMSGGGAVRPVFYLDSTKAKISGGMGTVSSPFIIEEP